MFDRYIVGARNWTHEQKFWRFDKAEQFAIEEAKLLGYCVFVWKNARPPEGCSEEIFESFGYASACMPPVECPLHPVEEGDRDA